ncbi:hypothetical protein Cantr_07185 [Candida viswanathii]|uniref:Uncharacterized protein n=1 Tax=Candida viswanathii TaxID=5486 RepID=A0A367XYV2_9ASCO|nr:hypothetical protein Cantr_07185 [Candida viswanathii]
MQQQQQQQQHYHLLAFYIKKKQILWKDGYITKLKKSTLLHESTQSQQTSSDDWGSVSTSTGFSSRDRWSGGVSSRSGFSSLGGFTFGGWQWAVGGVSGVDVSDSDDTSGDWDWGTLLFVTRGDGDDGGTDFSDGGVGVTSDGGTSNGGEDSSGGELHFNNNKTCCNKASG